MVIDNVSAAEEHYTVTVEHCSIILPVSRMNNTQFARRIGKQPLDGELINRITQLINLLR